MEEYFDYLREMLVRFFSDLGRFFNKVFAAPWADVPGNFDAYGSIFSEHNRNFNGLDWKSQTFLIVLLAALNQLSTSIVTNVVTVVLPQISSDFGITVSTLN